MIKQDKQHCCLKHQYFCFTRAVAEFIFITLYSSLRHIHNQADASDIATDSQCGSVVPYIEVLGCASLDKMAIAILAMTDYCVDKLMTSKPTNAPVCKAIIVYTYRTRDKSTDTD